MAPDTCGCTAEWEGKFCETGISIGHDHTAHFLKSILCDIFPTPCDTVYHV